MPFNLTIIMSAACCKNDPGGIRLQESQSYCSDMDAWQAFTHSSALTIRTSQGGIDEVFGIKSLVRLLQQGQEA